MLAAALVAGCIGAIGDGEQDDGLGLDPDPGASTDALPKVNNGDVDCSGIAQHGGFELCDQGPDFCAGVFTGGEGCAAYCAAAGLTCVGRLGGEPGCRREATVFDCNANNGHQSDWCVCGPGGSPDPDPDPDPDPSCAVDAQHPPAQADQHFSDAVFAPRSSWVLECRDYAYSAQYDEHEACDSQYEAGSGRGKATFTFQVNTGRYDVYVEGRHTANRNPSGARVEVNCGNDSHVEYIQQRTEPHDMQMDLHGRYCLSGAVEVVVDSSVSGASDSVRRVRLVPAGN